MTPKVQSPTLLALAPACLLVCAAGALIPLRLAHAAAACRIEATGLTITVQSAPDDGSFGPTLEIVVEDALQPLTRLMTPEARPVEACWWEALSGTGAVTLVIGLGAGPDEPAGARLFAWRSGRLEPVSVPELVTKSPVGYRFVLRNGALEAHPTPDAEGRPRARTAFRLSGAVWQPIAPASPAAQAAPAPPR